MRVAVLGCGLIGGSIGLALRRTGRASHITAYDRIESAAVRAVERGAADASAPTPAEAVADADVVFVATPVLSIPGAIRAASEGLKAGAIVTDVGSTKSRVIEDVESFLDPSITFLGGHPMAGTEEEGIEAASPSLFDGAWWILTPTHRVEPPAYRTVNALVASFGSHVLALEPSQHDDLMAVVSHIPHLTAATLMNLAAHHGREQASLLSLAAGGFRDVTRVAASNPNIWIDICRENRDAIARVLGELESRLSDLRKLIEDDHPEALRELLSAARESRRQLPGKPGAGEAVEITMPIPDRSGVLAEVTTAIGNLGVNIEDLQITHAEEGGRGLLRLVIFGVAEAKNACDALSARGYEPRSTSI